MATVSLLLILSVSLLLTNGDGTDEITVEVDPQNGNDDSCLSVRELIDSNQTESPFPCKTLNYALNGNETSYYTTGNCSMSDIQYSNIFIVLMDGVHRLVSHLQLVGATNVHILADNSRRAVIECVEFPNYAVDNFDNFFACNVDGLEFRGVVFEHCGPVSSNVFVYNCSNVVFESCTFSGNTGAPLQLRFVDDLLVENTIFEHNKNNGTAQSDNNETSITDLYNIIQTSGGLTFFGGEQSVTVHIENCTFLSNEASKNELRETRPVLLKQNGHGAAILIRLSGTYLSSFEIVNCKFIDNYAEVDGGAIYISYSDKSRNNSFNIEKTLFEENSVLIAAGGAVSINSFNLSYSNIFTFQDCQFLQNSANAGGGVSMALYDRDLLSAENPDKIFFDKCRFIDNKAINEGTAVGLFSLVHVDQVGFPVYFENCHFENNTSEELSTNGSSDTSAVASFRFPTIFEGTNIFINNTGGGIMLLNTRMQASGVMLFEGNSAVFGGGIMMDDRCLLEVQPHLNMTFSNNVASESGGGIYVDFPPIRFIIDIFNRLCFLQYNDGSGEDVPPQEWEDVTIRFINNTARLSGAAIYASDMQRCAWLGNDNVDNISDPLIFRMPSFVGRSPFYYEGNTLMVENTNTIKDPELATAPLRIHPSVNILNNLVQPGEILSITLYATDQVNNTREAVWSLSSPGVNTTLDALSANNDTYFYNVPSINENNASITLTFSLLKTLGFNNSLTLTVRLCHPGYVNSSNECVCGSNSHIRRCDDENRYVYLREGIWGGVHPDTGKLVTAGVLPGYIVCEQQGRLPGCLFKFDDPDAQCKSGRKGTLCGECTSGYSVTLDLQTCSPDDCVIGLVLFILFSCILLFVVCFVILFFNIPLPNELKAFIFYVQVIGLVYRPFSVVNTQSASIDPVAVIVNLLGFSVPIPFCISNGNTAQYIALLGYIPPLILITNVLFFAVGARFIKPLAHHSAIKGITTLFYFFYKYIADTSFVFLSCVKTDLGFVFQYDASTHCFSPYFGFFFVVGLLIVVFFVAPIPFCVAYSSKFRRPIKFQPYADVLTDGLKCKFLWWPGWDIGRRLPFVLISFFVVLERPSLILFFMCLAAMTVLIVQVICKPYENEVINIIEAFVALNLVLVVAVFLDPSSEQLPRYVGITLLFLPYIYCFVYIGYRIGKYGMEKFKEHKQMMSSENTPSVHGNDEAGEGEGEESGGGEGEESRGREHDTIKSKSYSTNSSRSDRGDTAGSRVKSSSSGEKTVSTIVTSRSGESPPFDDNEHSVALREPLMEDDYMF